MMHDSTDMISGASVTEFHLSASYIGWFTAQMFTWGNKSAIKCDPDISLLLPKIGQPKMQAGQSNVFKFMSLVAGKH